MNEIGWFIIGWLVGIVTTYWGIMLYTKYMSENEKKAYIAMYKAKQLAKELKNEN